jgi:ribosome-dependent ATPase
MTVASGQAARLDAVTLRYGRTIAVDAVTLALPAGCMVGRTASASRRY